MGKEVRRAASMLHWNGNQLCAIDTETTGLRPDYHEIVQLCILPLDANVQVRRDVLPFYVELVPDYPERADPDAMRINNLSLATIAQRGLDREKAKDLLREWIAKLKLPFTTFGTPKRIIPLGQNYAFDQNFMLSWLGRGMYSEFFDGRYRDTLTTANYLNDRAAMHAEVVPYSKQDLTWLCKKLGVTHERGHDALQDCVATAEVYRKMLLRGLIG